MTILETIPILEQAGKYKSFSSWAAIIALSLLFLTICLQQTDNAWIVTGIGCMLALVMVIIFIIMSIAEPYCETGHFKLIVRLDNSYPANEFYEKYKVLEHTKYTDVYTVEEITNESDN